MRQASTRWLVVGAVLSAALQGACSDCQSQTDSTEPSADRFVIGQISTELLAVDRQGKQLDLQVSLEDLIRERLSKSSSFVVVEREGSRPQRDDARLRLSARVLPDGFSGELHAFVSARVTHTGSIPLTADIDAQRPEIPDAGTAPLEDYRAHLEKALGEAVTALDQQARLLKSGNAGLIAALDHDEADVRIAAARALGERQATEAVEPLCELLEREQGQVGQAVVGVLAMIDDQRAAPCLIQWAGSEDRRVVLIIEPLATLGGEDAEAFLDMIAAGHDDARIRRAAEGALGRFDRSAPTKNDP